MRTLCEIMRIFDRHDVEERELSPSWRKRCRGRGRRLGRCRGCGRKHEMSSLRAVLGLGSASSVRRTFPRPSHNRRPTRTCIQHINHQLNTQWHSLVSASGPPLLCGHYGPSLLLVASPTSSSQKHKTWVFAPKASAMTRATRTRHRLQRRSTIRMVDTCNRGGTLISCNRIFIQLVPP